MRIIFLIMIGLSLLHAELTRDSATDIVSDNVSGLQWQDNEVGTNTHWLDAINRCEDLTLGFHSDWRLPNINELKSIVDRAKVNPAIKTGFVNISSNDYWCSTTHEQNKSYAWYVNFNHGNASSNHKIVYFFVRCVRTEK